MQNDDNKKDDEERRIAEVMQIAESLAADEVHDGYTRLGSATSGAFRFKWTARAQGDGRYVVHETIGGSSVAVTSPPMPKSEVLDHIDLRQRRLRQKIDDIRREWLVDERRVVDKISADATSAEDDMRDPAAMYDEIRRLLQERK